MLLFCVEKAQLLYAFLNESRFVCQRKTSFLRLAVAPAPVNFWLELGAFEAGREVCWIFCWLTLQKPPSFSEQVVLAGFRNLDIPS